MEEEMSEIERLYWEDATPERFDRAEEGEAPFGTWRPGKRSSEPLLPDCRHWRQRFELEGGLAVYASAWLDKPTHSGKTKRRRVDADIDIGLYLDSRWASEKLLVSPGFRLPTGKRKPGPRAILYPWEDWGVPEDVRLIERVLAWLLEQLGSGKSVEVGCMGGHGRTGTVLACLLVLQGIRAGRAIGQVRSTYCEEAVESRKQVEFISSLGT